MAITIVTPELLIDRIDSLLQGKVSIPAFGHEIVAFIAFEDEYAIDKKHEGLLLEVLGEFMDMHDVGQGDVGYEPYVPSRERIIELREKLKRAAR